LAEGRAEPSVVLNEIEQETVLALLSLGYSRPSAEKAVSRLKKNERILTVEDYVKKALQVI
jgi:Holliday junction resolvasome RuvABC DNA-binding subunit